MLVDEYVYALFFGGDFADKTVYSIQWALLNVGAYTVRSPTAEQERQRSVGLQGNSVERSSKEFIHIQ